MKDKFASLEEPRSKGPWIVLFAFGLMGAIFAYQLLNAPSHPIEGVIESVVAGTNAKNSGAVESVSVRLTDGSVVLAQVAEQRILQVGEKVRVMEQPSNSSGLSYEVIAKDQGSEP